MRKLIAAALVAALAAAAHAAGASKPDEPASADPIRDTLRTQLTAEWDVAARWRATDHDKLVERAAERAQRVRAAYALLRDSNPGPWVDPAARMNALRRRAAARHLLAIDRTEVELLAGELAQVDVGRARLASDRVLVETLAMPARDAGWPAKGDVARGFGTFVHDDSHATLSRHGLDLDVRAHAEAHAIADGVVRYAGPIRGLDQGVIVDHASFWSVTAKLGELGVHAGDHVARGERLGDANTHRLYLEVRIPLGPGGTPVDPELVLEARRHD